MKKCVKYIISCVMIFLLSSVHQVHLSQAMEAKEIPINFITSNGQKLRIKVDIDQPLANLRSKLTHLGRMKDHDIFVQDEGEIFPEDENVWKIREAMVNNTLSLKIIDTENLGLSFRFFSIIDTIQNTAVTQDQLRKAEVWGAGIENTIAHINDFQKSDLTLYDLSRTLKAVEKYYASEYHEALYKDIQPNLQVLYNNSINAQKLVENAKEVLPMDHGGSIGGLIYIDTKQRPGLFSAPHEIYSVISMLTVVLKEKFKNYKSLIGINHPQYQFKSIREIYEDSTRKAQEEYSRRGY